MTLINSSRDPDGDAMTWQWEQTAGPAVTLSDATAESPTFIAPPGDYAYWDFGEAYVGEVSFRLTATDEHGASATGTVSLDVYARPDRPSTLTAVPGDGHVVLRWTPGAANGAAIESWWYLVSADGGVTWRLPWRQAGKGAHVYRLVVNGLRNGIRHLFLVSARNAAGDGLGHIAAATPGGARDSLPPVAHATWKHGERLTFSGTYVPAIYLNGRGSTDPDLAEHGTEQYKHLTFRWTEIRDDPAAPSYPVAWRTLSRAWLRRLPQHPVDLLYQLTVTDGTGLSDTTNLAVNVRYPADRPSLGLTRRLALRMQPGQTPSRVLPAATGGDGALTYTLTPAAPGVMAFDAATRQVTFTPTAAGTWSFDYTVTDADEDLDEDADTITVSLRVDAAASTAPRFAAGAAIEDLRLLTGRDVGPRTATVPLARLPAATGGDGDLAYTLEPAVPGLSLDPRTRRITGTPTTAGSYAMTYRAVDSDADTGDADSAALTFTIEVVANTAPVALFAGQTLELAAKIPGTDWHLPLFTYPYGVDLRGYFFDADGDDLRFTADTLPAGVHISECTAYRWAHCLIPTTEGAWTFVVTATDSSGATATQTIRLTGKPANRPPVLKEDEYKTALALKNGFQLGKYATPHRTPTHIIVSTCCSTQYLEFRELDRDPLTLRAVPSDARLTIARIDRSLRPGYSVSLAYSRRSGEKVGASADLQ